ncbi:alpha/beta hydrolase [Flammeovirgaceae bacterium SG7u.111]|nr:alpha/beta hydrolase [Flammeovirgaceae bacterium SG7u.132]WPO36396.1 alpha/beta hydrolase [Flammeovirgaceae bacterium SG7u.111]
MSKKRRLKLFFRFISALLVIPLIGFGIFFYANEAPITQGKVAYNIPYSAKHTLDIYYPTSHTNEKAPVVLFIHGGAWIAGRKEAINVNRINGAINQLRKNGFTIISPSYTLARNNKSPFPQCIQDGFEAIQWISNNADNLQLDLDYFGVIGESAGAHIAMMNAFAQPSEFDLPYPKVDLDFVVDIYGPNNLDDLYHMQLLDSIDAVLQQLPPSVHEHLDLPKLLFGFDPQENPALTKEFTDHYSPIYYLNKNCPPVLIIHGNNDQVVPFMQSELLKKKLDSLGIENEFHLLENVNHAFAGANEVQKSEIQTWITDFILSRKK